MKKVFTVASVMAVLCIAALMFSCSSKSGSKEDKDIPIVGVDSDGTVADEIITPADNDELPDEIADTTLDQQPDELVDAETEVDIDIVKEGVGGTVFEAALKSAVAVELKDGDTKLAETVTDTNGIYSFDAALEKDKVYCVTATTAPVAMESCFKATGGAGYTVNINPVTLVMALLYKDAAGKDLALAETQVREYFKIISGTYIKDLDYQKYTKVIEGFEQYSKTKGKLGHADAAADIFADIKANYGADYSFSQLFDGFIIESAATDKEIIDGQENKVKISLVSSAAEVAGGFEVRWTLPDGTEKVDVNSVEISSSVTGDKLVTVELIRKMSGGTNVKLSLKTIVVGFYKAEAPKTMDISGGTDKTEKVNESVFVSVKAGTTATLNGNPVTEITYTELDKNSDQTMKEFVLEPAGTQFNEDSPLVVVIDLGEVFSGDPRMLGVERINSDGTATAMNVASGDPRMMTAAGDPIMMSAAGDPIMMSDGASRSMGFTTSHFSKFRIQRKETVIDMEQILEKWNQRAELQVKNRNNEVLNPFYFLTAAINNSSLANKAELLAMLSDRATAVKAEKMLYDIFSRKTGYLTNYDIFDNYYWIWRFLEYLEDRKAESANSAKIMPLAGTDLKQIMSYLYTSSTYGDRVSTLSDVLNPRIKFALYEKVLAQNNLPDLSAPSAGVFLGWDAAAPFTQDDYTKYALTRAQAVPLVNLMKTAEGLDIQVALDSLIGADASTCLWLGDYTQSADMLDYCRNTPDLFDVNGSNYLIDKGTGSEIGSIRAINTLKKYFPDLPQVITVDKAKKLLRALYLSITYGSQAMNNPDAATLLRQKIYDSIAILFSEMLYKTDNLMISEVSIDGRIETNNKAKNDPKAVPYFNDFPSFLGSVNISLPSASMENYTVDKVVMDITRYAITPETLTATDSKPVLLIGDGIINNIYPVENVSKDLFNEQQSERLSASLDKVYETLDISEFVNNYIKMTLTVFYKFNGAEMMKTRDFEFAVYKKEELPADTVQTALPEATLESRVMMAETYEPVANATVILLPNNIINYTDDTGSFIFTDLEPGYYDIEIYKEGFMSIRGSVMLLDGEYKVFEAMLTADKPEATFMGIVTGTIKDAATGDTVKGSVLTLKDGNGMVKFTEANDTGTINITELESGTYALSVNKQGYYRAVKNFMITDKNVDLGDINLMQARVCGNGVSEQGEACDSDSMECRELGNFTNGYAVCKSDCSGYDTNACQNPQTQVCGNKVKEGTELCDGSEILCSAIDPKWADGIQKCNTACDGYEPVNCVLKPVCANGEKRDTATVCGLNGNGKITEKCVGGQWVVTPDCNDPDKCVNGEKTASISPCGLNGKGFFEQECRSGQWITTAKCNDPDKCTDNDARESTELCGINNAGKKIEDCIAGQWQIGSVCNDPDKCKNGYVQNSGTSCGFNGKGFLKQLCESGQWTTTTICNDTDVCTNNAFQKGTTVCGYADNGTIKQECRNGQWEDTSICEDPDSGVITDISFASAYIFGIHQDIGTIQPGHEGLQTSTAFTGLYNGGDIPAAGYSEIRAFAKLEKGSRGDYLNIHQFNKDSGGNDMNPFAALSLESKDYAKDEVVQIGTAPGKGIFFVLRSFQLGQNNDNVCVDAVGSGGSVIITDAATSGSEGGSISVASASLIPLRSAAQESDLINKTYYMPVCSAAPDCGNGIREMTEECDGFTGVDCKVIAPFYTGGTADCKTDCKFDISTCEGGCVGITCGGHGTCFMDRMNEVYAAKCNCDQGYHAVGTDCVIDTELSFTDQALKECTAIAVGKAAGAKIYDGDIINLASLGCGGRPVKSLADLTKFPALTNISVHDDCITDFSGIPSQIKVFGKFSQGNKEYCDVWPSTCQGVTCGSGACIMKQINSVMRATCDCAPGLAAAGLSCVDPCLNVTCGGGGTCRAKNYGPVCDCPDGYYMEGESCRADNISSLCNGITCGANGTCYTFNFFNTSTQQQEQKAACSCQPGYHENGLDCVADQEVTITDVNLEKCVRDQIKKQTGAIYDADLINITQLYCQNRQIEDISSISLFTNLGYVNIGGNCIQDFTPVQGASYYVDGIYAQQHYCAGWPRSCYLPDDSSITCGGNGSCQIISEYNPNTQSTISAAACKCDSGYLAAGMKCVNPCDNQTCGGHGTCQVAQYGPVCSCENGYYSEGPNCKPSAGTLCEGITCGSHGTCEIFNDSGTNKAQCRCDSAYHRDSAGTSCLADQQITFADINLENCIKNRLGKSGSQDPLTDGEVLQLNSLECNNYNITSLQGVGYLLNINLADFDGNCITDFSPLNSLAKLKNVNGKYNQDRYDSCSLWPTSCDGIDCGGNGSCALNANNHAKCGCDQGFTAAGLSCENPCLGMETCGGHGTCSATVSGAVCGCDTGYYADGNTCMPSSGTQCENVLCSGHGTCEIKSVYNPGQGMQMKGVCRCDSGYYADGTSCVQDSELTGLDSGLEQCVRNQIYKQTGKIMVSDVISIKYMLCSDRNIVSLAGLNYFISLTSIGLNNNCITDFSSVPNWMSVEGKNSQGLSSGCTTWPGDCTGITCGGYGTCGLSANNKAQCMCSTGYNLEGLSCIDPCNGVDCGGHGMCGKIQSYMDSYTAQCDCDSGYYLETDLKCSPSTGTVCDGVTCSGNGQCRIMKGMTPTAECLCDKGYYAGTNLDCLSKCGNGYVDYSDYEACDIALNGGMGNCGDINPGYTGTAICKSDCSGWDMSACTYNPPAVCGNSIVESGETCDDGANNGMYGYCAPNCMGQGAHCGDGMKNGPEECDDGNQIDNDGCSNTCINNASLLISEYSVALGSIEDTVIEIYNNSSSDVDMSSYQLWITDASCQWAYKNNFNSIILPVGRTFVVTGTTSAAQIIKDAAEDLGQISSFAMFSSVEAVGIAKYNGTGYDLVDAVGAPGMCPGTTKGWNIAGKGDSPMKTAIRKSRVKTGNTNWTASAGTDPYSSEWMVKEYSDHSNIGKHGGLCNAIECGMHGYCEQDMLNTDPKCMCDMYYHEEYWQCVPNTLMFSEYIEGTGSSRAVEIFNFTPATVSLSPYSIKIIPDGGTWSDGDVITVPLAGQLYQGNVFVAAYDITAQAIADAADLKTAQLNFSGNDAIGLFYFDGQKNKLIDVIGDEGSDTVVGWSVAGVNGATTDHSLWRKPFTVTGMNSWSKSAGITQADSSWNVNAVDDFSDIGMYKNELDTFINLKPAKISNTDSPSFSFSATVLAGTTFECKLNASMWSSCTPIKNYTSLPEGRNTFYVRAIDSSSFTDPTPAYYSWTIDKTPPYISSRNPVSDATGVDINGIVEIVFNEPMDPAVMLNTYIYIEKASDNSPVTAPVLYSIPAKKVRLTYSGLLGNTQYRIVINSGVTDIAGNSTGNLSWLFTTKP